MKTKLDSHKNELMLNLNAFFLKLSCIGKYRCLISSFPLEIWCFKSLAHDLCLSVQVRLSPAESSDVLKRWAEHLCSPQVNHKSKAILVLLSLGCFYKVGEMLHR